MYIDISIPGEPVAQARPRVTRHGAYDPPKCRAYKELVGMAAKTAMRGRDPLDGPLGIELYIYRGIPKSWSKRKYEQAAAGIIQPVTKPDIDNYVKAIMDGMTGIVWKDDAQVVEVEAIKEYGRVPRAGVRVRQL